MTERRDLEQVADDSPLIEVVGLNKWFGELHVLNDIDLNVYSGEKIVICGPSGSGKSTLIRCLNALEKYQAGSVKFQGREVQTAREARLLRQNVGMVFQQFNLFPHLTVMENLTLAPRLVEKCGTAAAASRARYYLDKVKLAGFDDKYPAQMSGGQQQRVAIARALCMEPSVMLFDEPTSALDPETIGEVLETMIALAQSGMTMLCVTHEMTFARRVANRVLFMDDGKIVEDCSSDEFFEFSGNERVRRFLSQVLDH